jgi:hypothetical protein
LIAHDGVSSAELREIPDPNIGERTLRRPVRRINVLKERRVGESRPARLLHIRSEHIELQINDECSVEGQRGAVMMCGPAADNKSVSSDIHHE